MGAQEPEVYGRPRRGALGSLCTLTADPPEIGLKAAAETITQIRSVIVLVFVEWVLRSQKYMRDPVEELGALCVH